MSQQDPATPRVGKTGPDLTGGVGEHLPETPDDGDVDHLAGQFADLEEVIELGGGGPKTPDTPGD